MAWPTVAQGQLMLASQFNSLSNAIWTWQGDVSANGFGLHYTGPASGFGGGDNFATANASWDEFRIVGSGGGSLAADALAIQANQRATAGGSDNWLTALTIGSNGFVNIAQALTIPRGNSLTLQALSGTTIMATPQGTAGTTVYSYSIVAISPDGSTGPATTKQITNGNATLSATNYVAVSWTGITGAVKYRVYRTGGSANPGLLATVTTTSYNDTGASGDNTTPGADNTGQLSLTNLSFIGGYGNIYNVTYLTGNVQFGGTPTFPNGWGGASSSGFSSLGYLTLKAAPDGSTLNLTATLGAAGSLNIGPGTVGTDPRIYIGGSTATTASNTIVYDANTHLLRTSTSATQGTLLTMNSSGGAVFGVPVTLPASDGSKSVLTTSGGSAGVFNLQLGSLTTDPRMIMYGSTATYASQLFIDCNTQNFRTNNYTTMMSLNTSGLNLNVLAKFNAYSNGQAQADWAIYSTADQTTIAQRYRMFLDPGVSVGGFTWRFGAYDNQANIVRYGLNTANNFVVRGGLISPDLDPYGQIRMTYQNTYGAFFRNDGGYLYLLLTNSGDPYGSYNSYRPWQVNFSNGQVYFNADGSTNTTFGGTVNFNNPASVSFGSWIGYTPSVSGANGLSVTLNSFQNAAYIRLGAICWVTIRAVVTINNSVQNGFVNFTLPVTHVGTVNEIFTGVYDATVGYCYIQDASSVNFAASGGLLPTGQHTLNLSFYYRCA